MTNNTVLNGQMPEESPAGTSNWTDIFNARELRALEFMQINSIEEFRAADLLRVLKLPYIGELTYRSLYAKQQSAENVASGSDTKASGKMVQTPVTPLRATSPLHLLQLNPTEMQAFKRIGVKTVGDFIHCNLDKISTCPGIGRKKLVRLRELQEARKKDVRLLTAATRKATSPLDEYIWTFEWTTREFNALKEAGIQTVRDFLQLEVRMFREQKKVGRKTYINLFEKQKKMFEEYGSLLMREWNDLERPLLLFSEFNEVEQEFLATLGLTSIQEFIFTDFRILSLNEKYTKILDGLFRQQTLFKKRLVSSGIKQTPLSTSPSQQSSVPTSPEESSKVPPAISLQTTGVQPAPAAHDSAKVKERQNTASSEKEQAVSSLNNTISPLYISSYEQWERGVTEQSLRYLPFFSGHFNKGFDSKLFHPSFCADYPLDSLILPKRLANMLKKANITTLGELFLVPRRFFERISYCSQETVGYSRTILEEFLIDSRHKRFEPDFSSSENFAASIIQYLSTWLKRKERWKGASGSSEDRRHQILLRRAAGSTLDEVGISFGITRERIRQLEHNLWRQIIAFRNRMDAVEKFMHDTLNQLGGFASDKIFYQKVADRQNWTFSEAKYYMEHFMTVFSDCYSIIDETYISFSKYRCPKCPRFFEEIGQSLTELESDGEMLAIDKLALFIRKKLSASPECKKCPEKNLSFPNNLFYWLFETKPQFKEYRRNKTIRMTTKLGLYESILLALKQAKRPLTKREILADVQRLCPKIHITEKQIKTTAGNSLQHTREILLWNRGGMNSESMYVYKDYIKTDHLILEVIEKELLAQAKKNKVPQMRLNRIFGAYLNECRQAGIPNVYALFATLKCRAHPELIFQRSPYIGFAGQKQKVSNAIILENYVREKGGIVASTELKNYGRSLGLRDEHIQNTIALTRLIATKRGYVLFDHSDNHSKEFEKLTDTLVRHLTNIEHLTAMELYAKEKPFLESLNIFDARMLYYLLKRFGDDRFVLEYPIIAVRKIGKHHGLRTQVARRIQIFLADKKMPVSSRKIYTFFTDELGYPQAIVSKVLSGKDVLECGNNLYLHDSVIHWTREKQAKLKSFLELYWKEKRAANVPYGTVEEFLFEYRPRLPKIGSRAVWNRYLTTSLMRRCSGIRFLGNNRNIFCIDDGKTTLNSFGEFVKYILVKEYGGKTVLKDFAHHLSTKIHAIKRELTPFMLEGCDEVVIDDGQIYIIEQKNKTGN